MTDAADAQLAAQYEAFPYPARDPREEAKRLIVGSPSHLREVDHWIFGARRPATQPLRALIAGGGTGDAAIMLAQQLAWAGRPGEVVWLDRSRAARRIAEARAAARGLTNLRFEEGSLLELPGSGLGPFDYADCCGVLHHLPDPAEGLRALLAVLAPGGGLGLMVYAPHGRTGVYMLQDALRLLAPAGEAPPARLDTARRLWRQAPETAWLRHNPWLSDHLSGGDAGLYDLLLNPRDVAFTVPALAGLLDAAGLRIACWVEPLRYDPDSYLSDPRLRARTASLDPVQRAALAEAITGNMGIHIVYCLRADAPDLAPPWEEPEAVPVLREMDGAALARGLPADGVLPVSFDGLRVPLPLPRLARAILARVDGRRSIGAIGDELAA
ncbi:MAG TPA: class I SAM-dependent methyltransferase, partial [Crenalkalicoccus sp.]|nr:class I SAM-dependent methyltransferase [Crenalkalicoccus sp.]